MQETEEFLKGLTRGISNTIRLAYERGVKDGEERREAKALKNMAEYSQSRFQDGYERGLQDGYERGLQDGHERGLQEAWEAARRIEAVPEDGGWKPEQRKEIFGEYWPVTDIFNRFDAHEVLEKLKAWDERDIITVGDEVEDIKGTKGVVIAVDVKQASLLSLDYELVQLMPLYKLHKTGRRFGEVADLLEKLKGEK